MMDLLNPPPIAAEITLAVLRVFRDGAGVELPLQRGADGKLTAACRKDVVAGLRQFAGRQEWQPYVRALCGLGAHGVSLRKINLPPAGDDFENILRLQIEKEFPLPPDELAWARLAPAAGTAAGECLIAAVRKEVIDDYRGLFSEAGVRAEFTLSVFARELLCSWPEAPHALLAAEGNYCEVAWFDAGAPAGLKIIPAGGNAAAALAAATSAKIICVSGDTDERKAICEKLAGAFDCRPLVVPGARGVSAATIGLQKALDDQIPLPRLQSTRAPARVSLGFSREDFGQGENGRRLALAAGLLVLLILLPFGEALLFRPFLGWKLAAVKRQREQFVATVDPELHFFQALKQRQPPYLDAMYLFAQAASPGLSVNSLTINEQGDIALTATMQSAQQVTDFRAHLIASGFFSNITVEDQTPAPGQQKVNVRMTARWKPAGERAAVKIKAEPAPDKKGRKAARRPSRKEPNEFHTDINGE